MTEDAMTFHPDSQRLTVKCLRCQAVRTRADEHFCTTCIRRPKAVRDMLVSIRRKSCPGCGGFKASGVQVCSKCRKRLPIPVYSGLFSPDEAKALAARTEALEILALSTSARSA